MSLQASALVFVFIHDSNKLAVDLLLDLLFA